MTKSVTRRIIALMFATCGAGVMTYLALMGQAEAFTALVSTVGSVTGFYLGVKATQ